MSVCVGGVWAERQGERESQAGFLPSAEPDAGLDLMVLKSWPEPKSRVGCLTDWGTQVTLSENFLWLTPSDNAKKALASKRGGGVSGLEENPRDDGAAYF